MISLIGNASLMIKSRRFNLLQNASKFGCNVIAAFQPENVFYLTGFWGEAIAICTENNTSLLAPKLEVERALQESKGCDVISTERGNDLICTLISKIDKKVTCTDCNDQDIIRIIQDEIGTKLFIANVEPFFLTRRIKDEEEIEMIGMAAKILDRLYNICNEEIKAGLSERELQAKLLFEAMKMGAYPTSYKSSLNPFIIAGGPNGALPHAQVSDRKFAKGDMIIVDLTLRYMGYIADATRTFSLGTAISEMKKVYDIVKRSQQAGLNALRYNITCSQIDAICRRIISKEGYSECFIHSTGHGIGLDVHEPPWIRIKNEEILRANMAVTIEPGIYLQGKFGIRIEDTVIVGNQSDGKARVLNAFTKDLIELD
jgi:Xaa-Pro aminopeptidase/Xaa-Pro dipeptidase